MHTACMHDTPCRQILRVWDLCKHAGVMSWIKRLEAAYKGYTPEYIDRWAGVDNG